MSKKKPIEIPTAPVVQPIQMVSISLTREDCIVLVANLLEALRNPANIPSLSVPMNKISLIQTAPTQEKK
jgi:hypothetical protein